MHAAQLECCTYVVAAAVVIVPAQAFAPRLVPAVSAQILSVAVVLAPVGAVPRHLAELSKRFADLHTALTCELARQFPRHLATLQSAVAFLPSSGGQASPVRPQNPTNLAVPN